MNNVQKISHRFRIVFTIGFWIIPIFTAGYWLTAGYPMVPTVDVFIPENYLPLIATMPVWARLVGMLLTFIPAGVVMLILFFLIRLFKLFECNKIFTAENVRNIRRIGYTVLIGEIVSLFYHAAITALVSGTSGVVGTVTEIKFDIGDIATILTSFVVILIAWIMREGQKLQEESEYTI